MAGTVRPSVRLSEQQMAALRAAAERNGTTVSAILRQGAAQQVAEPAAPASSHVRLDPFTAALVALQGALRGLGLVDPMPEVGRSLARLDQVQAAASAEVRRARDGRAELLEQLVSGGVDVAEAARRDVEFAPWLDGSRPALGLRDRAVDQLRREAERAASGDAVSVHDALVERVDAAVGRAVEAGGRIVDVPRMVKLLLPARKQRAARDAHGMPADPWIGGGPNLPALSMEDLQGDAGRLTAWATATAAMDELDRLWQVADLLGEVSGWSFARWGKDTSRDVMYLVERDLPRPVWLAVMAGCGWRPGLILTAGRR